MSAFQAWAAKDFRAEIIGTSCGLFADACIQKNFCCRGLANDLSKPRSAIQLPSGTALLRWNTATQTELKPNRHMSVIDAA